MDSLDMEGLVGSVLQGVLGGRRKRSRGALRYLTNGHSSFLNASTLLGLAGVAWGLWETATQNKMPSVPQPGAAPTPGPPPLTVPPPLPSAAQATTAFTPPPLPVTPDVVRVLRLTLSAARADGTLAPHEREAILAQARAVGAERLVAPELDMPRPLAEIVAGVTDARLQQDLYTLAFTIVRADEHVNDAERVYLSELAGHLGLDAATVASLEQQAARRIGAASEGAQ